MTEPVRHRILIVDDEVGMRESCRKLLVSEGFDVETADNGMAGWNLFDKCRNFSVVLADLKMPQMGGIELIERISKVDQDVVLLVITAFAAIETAVEATKRGAYSYVPKPFTPDELLLPIRNGLERRELAREARRLREEREKRLLEVAFERSKSNTIINCMIDGVLVVNRERNIVLRNAAAAHMLPECAGLPLPIPLDRLLCGEVRNLLIEVLQSGVCPLILSRELTLGRQTFMVNASSVIDPSGDNLGAVAVIRDISERKKLEEAKSTFVSMVAHEVKSPLAAIEGYLQLIVSGMAGVDPQRDRAMLEKALARARMLRTMISELLNLRAMETGNLTLTRVPLDLRELMTEAIQTYRDKADAKRITLTFLPAAAADAARVMADRGALLTVFGDLVDNAVKYTPEGGHVTVTMQATSSHVAIAVRDDGIGVATDDQERIFDEFCRVKNEFTAHVPGTGLGLSIVKRLIELHDGSVSVRSVSGQGSEFTVILPAIRPVS